MAKASISTENSGGEKKVKYGYTKRVKELREREGILQKDFAEKIDVSIQTLSGIECGKKTLSLMTAALIKDKFDVTLDWLYGLSNDESDDASATLISLRKLFNLSVKTRPTVIGMELTTEKLTIKIDNHLKKFLCEIAEAERINEEKQLPAVAYEAWISEIKRQYNETRKEGEKGEIIEYCLRPMGEIESEFKKIRDRIPEPPHVISGSASRDK